MESKGRIGVCMNHRCWDCTTHVVFTLYRWICIRDQKVYAVKRLSYERTSVDAASVNNERKGLRAGRIVPRMVRMLECRFTPSRDAYFILE